MVLEIICSYLLQVKFDYEHRYGYFINNEPTLGGCCGGISNHACALKSHVPEL